MKYFLQEIDAEGLSIPESAQVFARGENLMVGIGEKARFEATGDDRFEQLAGQFANFTSGIEIIGEIDSSASSVIAFTAISFSSDSLVKSVLIVPESVLVIRNETAWIASFTENFEWPKGTIAQPQKLNFRQGEQSQQGFLESVDKALNYIDSGELSKVVLARDLVAEKPTRV